MYQEIALWLSHIYFMNTLRIGMASYFKFVEAIAVLEK